jgi:signal transduction histidine kinase
MRPNQFYLNIIFSITLAILLVLSGIFLHRMSELTNADERVEHSYQVINKVDLIKNNLSEAESGARGFLITNDSSFYTVYYKAVSNIPPLMGSLRIMTSDNLTQQKKLLQLQQWITLRLSYLQQTIVAKTDTGILIKKLLLGRNAMDSCLQMFATINSTELGLLADRKKTKAVYVYAAPRTFEIMFVFTLIIFIISFLFIAQNLKRRAIYQNDLERKLLELDRVNSDLQEFSFIASHNLQEPLRKLRVFSSRLAVKHQGQLNDEAKLIISRMEAAAAAMHDLMNDFINFINIHNTREELSQVQFKTIIDRVTREFKNSTAKNNLSVHIGDLGGIYGYPEQLSLLFKCLFDNSIKFSRKEVPAEIKIYSEIVGWKNLPEIRKNILKCPYYKVTIGDNGIGFDNIFSKKIFKLFQQLDKEEKPVSTKGTGLAIVEHIMINHHGFVTASGTPGEGAFFHLFFPMEKN